MKKVQQEPICFPTDANAELLARDPAASSTADSWGQISSKLGIWPHAVLGGELPWAI